MLTYSSELDDIYLHSVEASGTTDGLKIRIPFKTTGTLKIFYFLTVALFNSNGSSRTLYFVDWGTGGAVVLGNSAAAIANGKAFFVRVKMEQKTSPATELTILKMEISTDGKASWTGLTSTSTTVTQLTVSPGNTFLEFAFKFDAGNEGPIKISYYTLSLSKINLLTT